MQYSKAAFSTSLSVPHALAKSILLLLIVITSYSSIADDIGIEDYPRQNHESYELLSYVLNKSSLPYINEVRKLYKLRDYELIWSNGQTYNEKTIELVKLISNAGDYGLNPANYDIDVIEYFLESTINDPNLITKSDVTFSHAILSLAIHLHRGMLTSNAQNGEVYDHTINVLNSAIRNDALRQSLEKLQPNNKSYKNLLQALKKYKSIISSHENIKLDKKSLTIGDKSPEITKLRKLLHNLGDYVGSNFESEILDETLVLALSNYQRRHGLEADGILGRKTLRELNTPIQHRINQIELNLQRARHLPNFNSGRQLIINIPAYKLYVHNNNEVIFESRVIVGKRKNKTPQLSSELTELVLNPYWHVPTSIASKEIVPLVQEDPDYLYRNNMRLLSKIDNKTQYISPESIDWANIDFANSSIRIRQSPGKRNSLGRIKFIFPNVYNVYLHDTPARNLFNRNQRAYSHGCIRIEDPFGLAELLLSDSKWSKDDLNYYIQKNRWKTIKLEDPIPIHITYMTVWSDRQGIVHFRPDIYKQDSQIVSNLYNAAH